ncbi:MAG TPA: AraC family transcriptional regulator [Gemmatimonadaceae bacterium]|jgi:AraC family transcriptional regulator|nr:AraC family transcriptional regulator [Gemmatimonadaceae bacterium]
MKATTHSYYADAVQRVIEHVASHLDEALELDTMAAQACLSRFHFHRVFRGMVGETPMELVRRLRLERAAWRLIHTDRPVTAIAFDAGYETHEAFTRAFRDCYAKPPSEFRRAANARIELAAPCGVHFREDGRIPPFTPRESGGRTMQVSIAKYPELRVGTVRHVGPYLQINEAFATLGALAQPARLFEQPGAMMVALFHDDPDSVPADQLRSDAAVVVAPDTPLPDGLTEQRIPAGEYASTMHVGPYTGLGDSWARFMGEWLPASGRRMNGGVSYEVYLNTPMDTPPEKLRTEIRIPLASA